MVSGNPGTQITFFTATESLDGLVTVRGWEDDDAIIENEDQMSAFLRKVATSEETREAVERLIILASAIHRGE
jgi:hypothetical protein